MKNYFLAVFILFLFSANKNATAESLTPDSLNDLRLVIAAAQTTMPRRHVLFTQDMEVIANSCQDAYIEQTHKLFVPPPPKPSLVKRIQNWLNPQPLQPKNILVKVMTNQELLTHLRKTTRDPVLIGRLLELKRLANGALPSQEYISTNLSGVNYLILSQPDQLRAHFLQVYDDLIMQINSKNYLGCTQMINHLLSEDGGIL